MDTVPNTVPGYRSATRVGLIPALIVAASIGYGLVQAFLPMPPPDAAMQPQQATDAAPVSPRDECLRLAADPPNYSDLGHDAYWRAAQAWGNTCKRALAAGDDDPRLKVALAHTLTMDQRPEELVLLREAAAQDNAEANYMIYGSYNSWDQHLDRPQLIGRAEAEAGLRRAAELGYPEAVQRLAVLLDRGGVIKRDAAGARIWAERLLANPPKDSSRDSLQLFLGRLLASSSKAEERARGLDLLERLSRNGNDAATAQLGIAIRRTDPARARALLEQARPNEPGNAAPVLADMLLKGEGGPADPKRALKIVSERNDIASIMGARGQFYLDGRLVPRNVAEAVRLIGIAGTWDYDARLQELQLLAANPDVQIERPERVLFDALQAAELGEPGAKAALIDLKLSQHPQFRDKPGGCKLLEAAAASGDPAATQRLAADCATR